MTHTSDVMAQAVRAAIWEMESERAQEHFHSPDGQRQRVEDLDRALRDIAFHDPTAAACLQRFSSGDISLVEALARAVCLLSQEKAALGRELIAYYERHGGSSRSIFSALESGSTPRRAR